MLDYFYERFGVPREIFDDYGIYERNRGIWVLRKSKWVSLLEILPFDTAGLMILRRLDRGVKPTTIAFQLFGKWIKRNVVKLSEKEFFELIGKKSLRLTEEKSSCLSRGYVAVRVNEFVAGCAFYKENQLVSQFPKNFSSVITTEISD